MICRSSNTGSAKNVGVLFNINPFEWMEYLVFENWPSPKSGNYHVSKILKIIPATDPNSWKDSAPRISSLSQCAEGYINLWDDLTVALPRSLPVYILWRVSDKSLWSLCRVSDKSLQRLCRIPTEYLWILCLCKCFETSLWKLCTVSGESLWSLRRVSVKSLESLGGISVEGA